MRIVQISFHVDPLGRPARELLESWRSLVDIAEAARAGGHDVTVVQAATADERIDHNGIPYHFVRNAGDTRLLDALAPDVIHVHGLGYPLEVLALRASRPRTPILLQDHADRAPRLWRRGPWRRGLAAADGISFCAREQAGLLAPAMRLPPGTRILEVPESTSRFVPGDRESARSLLGLHGDPCVLWVGHLDDNKDPLTVLDGVARAATELPGIQLWCCFVAAPRLRHVARRLARDPILASRVHLLGHVPHARVQQLMHAADLFVLGSHREGSGYSVIEALACGLPPVVTDIPSFRSLVGNGTDPAGALWPRGDAAALAAALVRCARAPQMRAAARRRFEDEVSFAAVGRKLGDAYRALHAARRGTGG